MYSMGNNPNESPAVEIHQRSTVIPFAAVLAPLFHGRAYHSGKSQPLTEPRIKAFTLRS